MQTYELAKVADFILFNLMDRKESEVLDNSFKDGPWLGINKKRRIRIIKIRNIVETELIKYHQEKNIADLLNDDEKLDKFLSELIKIIKSELDSKEVS